MPLGEWQAHGRCGASLLVPPLTLPHRAPAALGGEGWPPAAARDEAGAKLLPPGSEANFTQQSVCCYRLYQLLVWTQRLVAEPSTATIQETKGSQKEVPFSPLTARTFVFAIMEMMTTKHEKFTQQNEAHQKRWGMCLIATSTALVLHYLHTCLERSHPKPQRQHHLVTLLGFKQESGPCCPCHRYKHTQSCDPPPNLTAFCDAWCLGWRLQTSLLSKHLHFIHVLLDTQAGSQQGTENNCFLHFPFKHTIPVAFHQHTSLWRGPGFQKEERSHGGVLTELPELPSRGPSDALQKCKIPRHPATMPEPPGQGSRRQRRHAARERDTGQMTSRVPCTPVWTRSEMEQNDLQRPSPRQAPERFTHLREVLCVSSKVWRFSPPQQLLAFL